MEQPKDIDQVLGDLLDRAPDGGAVTDREIDQLAAAHPHLEAELRKLRLIVQAGQRADRPPSPSPTPVEPADGDAPPALADYELLRLLSRGGFGQVWLGRNRHTGRLHAVKLIGRARGVQPARVCAS